MSNLNDMGIDYTLSHLEEEDMNPEPIEQFSLWMNDAIAANHKEPNAMNLATVDKDGHVSSRMVLLKYFDENGFVFFTHYNSMKGRALAEHPQAVINFWWPIDERQVRIDGLVEKIPEDKSDLYWETRSKGAQISAWLSRQGEELKDKKTFVENFKQEMDEKHDHQTIPRPSHWGGYVLKPSFFEFWQGGPSRIHDRICYTLHHNKWMISRLYP